ncbi:MAG TPA: ABC transporter substrate-binding protein [Burkholderiaceae bacterium]|nr:ABC transporter substrate-binding protein [Burkholderiaceae bacterium]
MSRNPLTSALTGLAFTLSLGVSGLAMQPTFAQVAPAAAATAPDLNAAPDELVRKLSTEVLASIKSDPALQNGDLPKLQQLVDERILPYVNFEKMTQLAVGRGWRQATPEQRQALSREFRTLLVRTYAGAMSQVRDHQVKMLPFRPGNPDDVVVRTQIVAPRGDPIQLDYRLEKTAAGWKIYDVNVLGVWLVENYKNSFASEINQSGIDGLIKALTERNKQFEAAKKA